jgi:glutathione S-transferase
MKYADQGTPLLPSSADLQAWARFEEAASVEQNNFDPYASGIAYEKVFKT